MVLLSPTNSLNGIAKYSKASAVNEEPTKTDVSTDEDTHSSSTRSYCAMRLPIGQEPRRNTKDNTSINLNS